MGMTRRILGSASRGSLLSDVEGRINSWRLEHRRLAAIADDARATPSADRINRFASSLPSPSSYLEIGVEHGYTLEAVGISSRVGVDPHPMFSRRSLPAGLTVHPVTSDEYFGTLGGDALFDVIFLDGLHTYRQTYRDLINSLHHLVPQGVVIIDDVVPSDELSSMSNLDASIREQVRRGVSDFQWHGDVFRLISLLRDHHPELQFRTVVGTGNEQTVLWKTNPQQTSLAVDEATLEECGHVSYEATFSHGVPEYFRPGSDDEVLGEFQRHQDAFARLRLVQKPASDESTL
jgi:hypothetical protein